MAHGAAGAGLVGRARPCALLAELLAGEGDTSVVVLHGEPGIGKTALLRWLREAARADGRRVLAAAAIPTETELPFAGLHQLLLPLLDDPALDPERRSAVVAAMSAPDAAGEFILATAMAVLDLLTEATESEGLLVVVDDVQWLDRPSRDVLIVVARRLGDERVLIAAAVRNEPPPAVTQAALSSGWRVIELERLDDLAAAQLLDSVGVTLSSDERRRILAEAAGNPLALRELPKTITDAPPAEVTTPVPVSGRLEAAFASRMTTLPTVTRELVLLAAAQDGHSVGDLLEAGRHLVAEDVTLRDLEPAIAAGLVEIDHESIRFGHPLVRSAVYQHAGPAARHRVHRVLAATAASADRRAWHAAAAAEAPDESVAEELEDVAVRACDNGAVEIGLHAYQEAARLSVDPGRRALRLLMAGELLEELNQRERMLEMFAEVDPTELAPSERARFDWLREVLTHGDWTGGEPVVRFAEIARRVHAGGDARRAATMLLSIALRGWWSNLSPDDRAAVAAAVDEIAPSPDHPVNVITTALATPLERGSSALAALERIHLSDLAPDVSLLNGLGLAATGVGDHPRAVAIFSVAMDSARRQHRRSPLGVGLVGTAWSELHIGRLRRAEIAAEEAVQLWQDADRPTWGATGMLALAGARGMLGKAGLSAELADEAEQQFIEMGAYPMLALVRMVRGVTALGRGQYEEALGQLRRVYLPQDVSYHLYFRTFVVAQTVEAAIRCGAQDVAREIVEEMEPLLVRTRSPVLRAGLLVARPLVAEPSAAEPLFRAAFEDGLMAWPMHRARLHLEYGAWLRRQRRVGESREPLRAAQETFAALGAQPWSDRAAQELRAAGGTPAVQQTRAWEHLTSQELQVAWLAAQGHTNRQIGERLFLSHRTVSSHLYHIFPKLGITSRAQLGAALAGLEASDVGGPADLAP